MNVPDDQAKVSPTSITSPSPFFSSFFLSYPFSLSPLLFFSFWPLSALFSNHLISSSHVIFTDTSVVPPLPYLFTETESRRMHYSFKDKLPNSLGLQSRFGNNSGQTTWNLNGVSPKRDRSSKRAKHSRNSDGS